MTRFAGTLVLSGLALRTDRLRIAAVIVAAGLGTFALASGGAPHLSDEVVRLIMVVVAVTSVLLVTPHLRGAESRGCTELTHSGVVGRYASVTAGLVPGAAANLGACAAITLALTCAGTDAAAALRVGAGVLVVGLASAALAALTSQLCNDPWAANALALGPITAVHALGLARYLDLSRWSPIVAVSAVAAILVICAYVASVRRDLGSPEPRTDGRNAETAAAPPSALRFLLEQQRTPLLVWGSAILAVALAMGNLGRRLPRFVRIDASPDTAATLCLTLVGVLAALYAVSAFDRFVRGEVAGRTDSVLTLTVSRSAWFRIQLATIACGTLFLTVVGGFGVAFASAFTVSDTEVFWRVLPATATLVPALAVVLGIAAWTYGHAPNALGAVRCILTYVAVIALFEDRLPTWTGVLSPFAHMTIGPAEAFAVGPAITLIGIAAVATVLGVEGFRRRDVGARSGSRHETELGRLGQ